MNWKTIHGISIADTVKHLIWFLIIPTLSLIIIYLVISYCYFVDDALNAQQVRLESTLEKTDMLNMDVEQFFHSVQSIPEMTYILDFYSKNSDVLYSMIKTLRPQINSLLLNSNTISNVRIFSLKPLLLHAEPLYEVEAMPLLDTEKTALSARYNYSVIWHCIPAENCRTLPDVYAYRRLSGYDYDQTVGYMEAQLSEKSLLSVINDMESVAAFRDGKMAIYQNGKMIYSADGQTSLANENCLSDSRYSWKKVLFPSFTYVNCVSIPSLSLQIVISGSVFSLSAGQPMALLLLLFGVLLTVALLLMRFYRRMQNLALQITEFSSFMQATNPETLTEYDPQRNAPVSSRILVRYAEMDSLVASYNHLIIRNRELQFMVHEMEMLTAESRYQALQAQIHPHFIYGTLENIRMLALQNHDMDTAAMIFSLSRLIRRTISISTEAVSLKDELEVAHDYLKIQQIRLGSHFTYEESVQMDPEKLFLPSFTLQPLLENAIVHGISKTDVPCLLSLHVEESDKTVRILVSNSGVCASAEQIDHVNRVLTGELPPENFETNGHGRALYNISERLRILYNGEASLRLEQDHGLMSTCITISRDAIRGEEKTCSVS